MFKYASPIAGPWAPGNWEAYEQLFKENLALMEKLSDRLSDLADDRETRLVEATEARGGARHIEGAPLRAIRRLLDEHDPSHHWGGLRKVLTPEGHYLWLCEHHAQEYQL